MEKKEKKKLYRYMKGLHRSFLHYHENCRCDDPSAEDIHQLRVTIKKIRAFLDLLALFTPAFSAKKYYRKHLRTTFKRAGQVRDFQIIRTQFVALQANANGEKALFDQLEYGEKNAREKLEKHLSKKKTNRKFIKKGKKRIKKIIRGLRVSPEKAIRRFSRQTIGKLDRKLRSGTSIRAKRLHQIRKYIKRLYYTLHMGQIFFPDLQVPTNLVDDLHELQDRLGDWHDLWISRVFLKEHMLGREYPELLQTLYEKETFTRQVLYRDLQHYLDKYGESLVSFSA